MQTFAAKDGRFNRDNFFGQNEALARLAQGMTDEQIDRLKRGGHDLVKIHAAYGAAARHRGQPTVILAHTKKGYGMGKAGQGRMTTHSHKKLDEQELLEFRNRFNLPLADEQVRNLAFYQPADDSPEMRYLHGKRAALGGYLPRRQTACEPVPVPDLQGYAQFALQAGGKEMSTTMAFVRLLGALLKDGRLGPRIVPIVADEARTFGMANLFKQVGIYSSVGQKYEPEDSARCCTTARRATARSWRRASARPAPSRAGRPRPPATACTASPCCRSTSTYSMFGFQRVGDAIWAAADQRARGFLLGATSGRTTLAGEGLQHQDGSSHLVAATLPNCKAYDPAFAGELAVIVDAGMREMLVEQRDVFYYVTLMNENYGQPDLPAGARDGVIRGCYRFGRYGDAAAKQRVTLLGSGAILIEVIRAAEELARQGVASDVFSVTSWSELAREGAACEREAMAGGARRTAYLASQLAAAAGPVIGASDYVRAVPESIRAWVPAGRRYLTLGTDDFGRSDTRAALRSYFGVDAASIVKAALHALAA